jgi:hypothetical protein
MPEAAPPPPPTPYRDDGRPLTDLIPPDRRRLKAAVIVGLSMLTGAMLILGAQQILAMARRPAIVHPPPPPSGARRVAGVTLDGPGGPVTLPGPRGAVVHVWLQGCADCMPAFDAMFALEKTGGLAVDVPVVNVAYGDADLGWARAHGVANNLVIDRTGAAIVRPLGIGTFTTLVVDSDGVVRAIDRPDRVGFAARVQRAVQDMR